MRGARASRIGTALLVGVLVAGCSGSPDEPAPETPDPQAEGSVASDPTQTEPSGLLLTEVGVDEPFVELANPGSAPADLAGLSLVAGGRPVDLPEKSSLDPGEHLLVALDAGALDPAQDGVFLYGADEALVDSVLWGAGQAGSVSLVVGDFASTAVEPGTSIGRPPGADRPVNPLDWVVYPVAEASPGKANPVPSVTVLLPMNGAILDDSDTTLSWSAVTGATSYRVEVAADEAFTDVVLDETVEEPIIDVGELDVGTYTWRVQASADGATASAVSYASFVTLDREPKARVPFTGPTLAVPKLYQNKDTRMLLLEEPHETGEMAWDAPHDPHRYDPADKMNCAIAMIAMINRFYGGTLSQDRIGYEIFKDRRPGPEEDLNWGWGLTSGGEGEDQTLEAFQFALGAPVGYEPDHASMDDVWGTIVNAIDGGQPVAGAGEHHGYVIKGYDAGNGQRRILVNDPARGTYSLDIDTPGGEASQIRLWTMPEHVNARKQEPGVTKDSDGDGVVDFDETERFHTDPGRKDSDGDKVDDKADIVAGVFDATYGYALKPGAGNRGRDFDGDNLATELDPDSDQGGCGDGDEDASHDGHKTGKETWNFDAKDDVCGDLSGTITWTLHDSTTWGYGSSTTDDTVTLSIRFDEDDGQWVDAGSSYSWSGSSRTDESRGDDPEAGYCTEFHKRTTTTGGEAFEGALASSIYIDVYRDSDEVYVSSWVAGELVIDTLTGTLTSDGGPTSWCELVPDHTTQGGGSTVDSQAEWGQVPRCINSDESVLGKIAEDGKAVTFDCTNTETYELSDDMTSVETMTVTGQLTFASAG